MSDKSDEFEYDLQISPTTGCVYIVRVKRFYTAEGIKFVLPRFRRETLDSKIARGVYSPKGGDAK